MLKMLICRNGIKVILKWCYRNNFDKILMWKWHVKVISKRCWRNNYNFDVSLMSKWHALGFLIQGSRCVPLLVHNYKCQILLMLWEGVTLTLRPMWMKSLLEEKILNRVLEPRWCMLVSLLLRHKVGQIQVQTWSFANEKVLRFIALQ
jgi:hypothetical protein